MPSDLTFIKDQLSSIQEQLKVLMGLQIRVNQIEEDIKEIKESQSYISNFFDTQKDQNEKFENQLKQLEEQCQVINYLKENVNNLEK